jgi:hypothetical protein
MVRPDEPPLSPESQLPALRLRSPSNDDPIAEAAAELFESSQVLSWSQPGSLGPEDLTIRIQTPITNSEGEVIGMADFNLRALNGYRNSPKCNLLAFEVAFRAGFVVPLVGRVLGWGFPASGMLVSDAADGEIRGDWAVVRRRPVASEINLDRDNGLGLMVVGSAARQGRYGHVALIDWVDALELTREGEIAHISFMGWEAKPNVGARYGEIGFTSIAHDPAARFAAIYILELRSAELGNEVAVIGSRPRNPTQAINMESGR